MSPAVEENVVSFPPSVLEEPAGNLRYMRRRKVAKADRNGDPLDGIINLFDVAIVLAVAFLLAALTGLGLSELMSNEDVTIVKNPGQSDMQVITKQGSEVQKLDLQPGQQVTGVGQLIGQFYLLADGTTVYVPVGGAAPPGATPSGTAPTPGATVYPTPGASTYPTPGTTLYPTPQSTVPAPVVSPAQAPDTPFEAPQTAPNKKDGGTGSL